MRLTIVLIIVVILLPTTLLCQKINAKDAGEKWNLMYANDENGNRISGDIRELINVVRQGESIRIGWTIEHPTNKSILVEHYADAKFITIMSDSVVFAQIDPIVGQTPSLKDKSITLKENIEWAFSASTRGNNDSMNTNKKTGEIIDHKVWKCGIRWFAKIRD